MFAHAQKTPPEHQCDHGYQKGSKMKRKFLDSLEDKKTQGCKREMPRELPLIEKDLEVLKKYLH